MKTTATTMTTTARRAPRSKGPSHLDGACSFLATTSKGMLSFLARLSGRRRTWRHCRQQRKTDVNAMPESTDSTSSTGCARCRAHSRCSCDILGLREEQQNKSMHEDDQQQQQQQQQQCSNDEAQPDSRQAHCRRSRHHHPGTETADETPPLLLRRRPPELSLRTYLAATLLILSSGLLSCADACSSRSTPKPRPPTPTPRPNITFHMYTCPPDYAEWYCLNGATCFTVKIVDSLLYNCLCANGYIGQRCEFKDLEGSYMPKRHRVMLETASIAGAVTIAVFLAVITFISVYIHCKRKQKELRMMSNGNGLDVVDGPPRDPELRPFCSRSRSLMIFMAKNPNGTATPPIEQTRMPNWNYTPTCPEASTRMANINESKRPSQ